MLAEKGTQHDLLIYLSSAPLSQVGQLLKGYEVLKSISWRNTIEADRVKPQPIKHLFGTSNFNNTLVNCFFLEHSALKTKQLKLRTSKVTSTDLCLNGRGWTPYEASHQLNRRTMGFG